MAEFLWVQVPRYGTCLACGTSSNDRGFVDTIVEVSLTDESGMPGGFADCVFCANCLEQMGQRVGMASKAQVDEFAYREFDLTEQVEKLKDEVRAWQQRLENLLSDSFTKNVRKIIAEEKETHADLADSK